MEVCPKCGRCGKGHEPYKKTGTKWTKCDKIRLSQNDSHVSCTEKTYQDPVGKEGICRACILGEQRTEHRNVLRERLKLDVQQKKREAWGDSK
jgi:hypothetical protein